MENDMGKLTLKDKLYSKKFIFSIITFGIISGMLFFEKLPPNYYESIAISIIITYLSSNVAYRYVNGKNYASNHKVIEDEIEREEYPEMQIPNQQRQERIFQQQK